jgi:Na+-driven multidrug efflux pump
MDNKMAVMPVGKLMLKMGLPIIISMMLQALYNIVDQIFIANASYLGSYGNAANTVVFPLTVIALGHCSHDRRRLLCLCESEPWQEAAGYGKEKRR